MIIKIDLPKKRVSDYPMIQNAETHSFVEKKDIILVKSFFDQWQLYKKIVDNNYLHHLETYAILHDFLSSHFMASFSIMDLGCGDAHFMAYALQHTKVREYVGVDVSEVALEMARENMALLDCQKLFSNQDFVAFMNKSNPCADIIWMGLSLHHLSLEEKDYFISSCHRALANGGYLMIFDPVMRSEENREDFIYRWWDLTQRDWRALSVQEKQSLRQHVFFSDFPERLDTFIELGKAKGYKQVFSPYCDCDEIYRLVCFRK
jgi:SAM-dependent methyltransferase